MISIWKALGFVIAAWVSAAVISYNAVDHFIQKRTDRAFLEHQVMTFGKKPHECGKEWCP